MQILKNQQDFLTEQVPVYKKHKNKGVAIAREFKNTDALVSRLKQANLNLLNLVELDDKAGFGTNIQLAMEWVFRFW